MDSFDLTEALRPTAAKVIYNALPVAYDYGDEDALLKWLVNMNGRQADKILLKRKNTRKYPLIWMTQSWTGAKNVPGWRFNGCEFYISVDTTVAKTNANRVPEFEILFQIANSFIQQLKLARLKVVEDSIEFEKRPNFSEGANKKNKTIDVWDTLILRVDLIAYTNCVLTNLKK